MVRVTESQFADYVTLYAGTQDSFESVTNKFVQETGEWNLTANTEKMNGIIVEEMLQNRDISPVHVEGERIEMVDHFTYM